MDSMVLVIFKFAVLVFSVIVHEVAHGVVAEKLGDPTARQAGRITLNPIKHIDLVGSILVPAFLFLIQSPVFLAWAKPVPYDPRFLPNPKAAAGKIAAAGPLSNFILAAIFAALTRVLVAMGGSEQLIEAFAMVVLMNIWLGVFNLVPIPPLDGSKVLFSFLPSTQFGHAIMDALERYGIILIFVFVFYGGRFLSPIVKWIFGLFLGVSF